MSQIKQRAEIVRIVVGLAVTLTLPVMLMPSQSAAAATAGNTAILAGTVRDEAGVPVEASVSIATQGLRQQAITAPDGAFQFSNLRTGTYVICARVTGRNARPQDEPFVDSCLWQDRTALKVSLAPGENRQGVNLPLKHGYLLKVRVNDPGRLLPPAVGKTAGNHLYITLAAPSSLGQHVPIIGEDSAGRDHGIVIPYDTPHKLVIHSSTFVVQDGNGRDINASAASDVRAERGAAPQTFVVNIIRRKP